MGKSEHTGPPHRLSSRIKTSRAFFLGMLKVIIPCYLDINSLQLGELLLIKSNAGPEKIRQFSFCNKWTQFSCLFIPFSLRKFMAWQYNIKGWLSTPNPLLPVNGRPPAPERISPWVPIYVLWITQKLNIKCKIKWCLFPPSTTTFINYELLLSINYLQILRQVWEKMNILQKSHESMPTFGVHHTLDSSYDVWQAQTLVEK